eukprot:TRINITY_DN20868_c0_g1_i1.p1 TRINITY_DN20868_c0_g1~~TRINITY_DN20868_c0_g1_i1.p1  ORF type:complete len:185 (+),score=32.25 TRINITY_DN20868_c0_g1_i1:119-673(+)
MASVLRFLLLSCLMLAVSANKHHVDFILHFFGQMDVVDDSPSNTTWAVTSTSYSTTTKTKLTPASGITNSVEVAVGASANLIAKQWNNGSPDTFYVSGTINFAPAPNYAPHAIAFETVNPGTIVPLNSNRTEALMSAVFVITSGGGMFAGASGSFVATAHVNMTSGTFKDYQAGRIFLPHSAEE